MTQRNLDIAGLAYANRIKVDSAARQRVSQARSAIRILRSTKCREPLHDMYLAALQARIASPHISLAEVAAEQGLTKHAYWSRLRRALDYAARLQQSRP